MNKHQVLLSTKAFIKKQFSGEGTGHDYFHIERVVKLAQRIAKEENASLFITELAAWLHDLGDHKLNNGVDRSEEMIKDFLNSISVPGETIQQVASIVSQVSFSKGKIADSPEAKILQDADRLDAIGAIGIARVFSFGGSRLREIYNPEAPAATSIQHFYDKLLKLKDLMNTASGRRIAESRHRFLEVYLERFYDELEGQE